MRTEQISGSGRPERRGRKVVVGAAIISGARVLACARTAPPEVAGLWEFPGGKVEPGESETAALVRECAEELAVRIEVGDRVGGDSPMAHGRSVLKVYVARLLYGDEPKALEHSALRWLTAAELDTVTWLPADVPVVEALRPLLRAAD
ncbi:(deoxy)nucleoside triphosphate pyrophosphohydrolase [Micromonospora sp. NPDC000207]|uniref:(deoxy)nucleoside triphosphate pyrophosphohydrolase n=1 Tax=Micromonospora sp. NPDC000207 TaxID=3154246 RepID=UPI003320B61D